MYIRYIYIYDGDVFKHCVLVRCLSEKVSQRAVGHVKFQVFLQTQW